MTFSSPQQESQFVKLIRLAIQQVSLAENFQPSSVKQLVIPANDTLYVSHGLGMPPKYWIFLRQKGGAPVVEGSTWNDEVVSFTNMHATNHAYVTVLLMGR